MSNVTQLIRNKRDQQNFNIITQSVASNKCVRILVGQGFIVLSVKIEASTPEIWIQHCKKCETLEGVSMALRNGRNGREREYIATVQNCKVKWIERV